MTGIACTVCAFHPLGTPHVKKAALNWTAQYEAPLPFCSNLSWQKGWDRTSEGIHLLCCPMGYPMQATHAQTPVLRVCYPSAGLIATPYTALHTSTLISYKCKRTESQISPLALHLLKGHQGSVIFFPANRDIRS